MSNRIDYLKTITKRDSADIQAFRELSEKEYYALSMEELARKAHFLTCFAREIPLSMDKQERLVGSMRFMDRRQGIANRNKGHIIVDYRMILREGIGGIRRRIAALKTPAAEAMEKSMAALVLFMRRHAEAAEAMDMTDVAENCRFLTENAPQNFHQALQLIWFVHLFLHAEGVCAAVSFGRFDDYMYPFYRRDMETGALTREEAKELLMCFWLKTCEGDESQNLTLGGDVENELTCLCMEVTRELKVRQPSVSVRICENTTQRLWNETLQLIKAGIGMPAIFNDAVVIRSLENAKVEPEDAKNYAIVGCYEANSDGNTFGTTACAGLFYLSDVLLEFLKNGEDYPDYPVFYRAFLAFFKEKYNTDILAGFRKNWEDIRTLGVSPFQSACMSGCLESGIPAEWGGCKYTMAGINILGIGTLVDSLYAMKKVVFENNTCTYRDFVQQVLQNFPDERLARTCRELGGKFGTDNPETNAMAAELSTFIADLVENGGIYEGVTPYAGLFVFLRDIQSADQPATPDGRRFGERLSYGVAASDICTGKSVTSMLNSSAHIAHDRFADGNPLMFSLSQKDVQGERGDALLKALIQSYFANGGFHVQINITDAETLRQAKANPQEYSDLIVRISGYSAYFTRVGEDIQTALIERSE